MGTQTKDAYGSDSMLSDRYKRFWLTVMLMAFTMFVVAVLLVGSCLGPVFGGEIELLAHPVLENMVGLSLFAVASFALATLLFRDLDHDREVQFVKPDFETREGVCHSVAGIRPEALIFVVCIVLGWLV